MRRVLKLKLIKHIKRIVNSARPLRIVDRSPPERHIDQPCVISYSPNGITPHYMAICRRGLYRLRRNACQNRRIPFNIGICRREIVLLLTSDYRYYIIYIYIN